MKQLAVGFFLFIVATPLLAQVSQERQILVIPRADHPQAAKDSGLGGRVTVFVTVDNSGDVVSVGNVNGPDNVCSSVIRADVIALRESAKTAALNAKFAAGEMPTTIQLNFEFPSRDAVPTRESDYSGPVNVAPKAEVRTSSSGQISSVTGEAHPVKSERVFSAQNALPPDYTGPVVSTSGSAGTSVATKRIPSQISGGVLNGKATNLPKPPFPPAARAGRAEGAVSIQVLIDEDGNVFSAAPVSGHPLLRAASREAACGASFAPTMLSGTPVKVSGVIVYNFVP